MLCNEAAVWLNGNALLSINEVTLRRTRLVLGWVFQRQLNIFVIVIIIKCEKLTSLQHRVRATNSHIQNGKNHFTRPS